MLADPLERYARAEIRCFKGGVRLVGRSSEPIRKSRQAIGSCEEPIDAYQLSLRLSLDNV